MPILLAARAHHTSTRHRRVGALLAHISVCTALTGCMWVKPKLPAPERRTAGDRFLAQPAAEKDAVGQPQWGLAVSGGGIRSATVATGALKALYDKGVLERVNLISTVSGGGYAAYWLYSHEYRDASRTRGLLFGASSFADSVFPERVCELATTGNFVSIPGAIWRWVKSQDAPTYYSEAIRRSFGHANYDLAESYRTGVIEESDPIEFHELREAVTRRLIPNWIVNSRVYKPHPTHGFADGMYELSPFSRGTATRGYEAWPELRSYPIVDGVAASGAAVAFALDRRLPEHVASHSPSPVHLSDGGHGENLGALALVRRRVPNIIIVDAEHDAKLRLDSYYELKSRLEVWGDTLYIPGFEELRASNGRSVRPPTGAFTGTIRSASGYTANVYYLKLSIPMSANAVLASDKQLDQRAISDRTRIIAALDSAPLPGLRKHIWDCRALKGMRVGLRELGVYEMKMFIPDDLNTTEIPKSWADFPHKSTFALSLNIDRTMAQIAIGYLLGEELAGAIARSAEVNARH